ncbi:MAG: hypothetical protein KC586_23490 [Myxococcales bacterium]|nr:hypothetical protein [Myxococcales bacterium]
MGLPQLLMMVVMVGGMVGWWWFKHGRHGANAYKFSLGLRADEEPTAVLQGYFKIGFEKKDVALALVGVERVGKWFTIALTPHEMVLRPRDEDAVRYGKGGFRVAPVERDVEKLVGLTGQKEPADVFVVEPRGGAPFHLVLARSAGDHLAAWSQV